VVTGTEPQPRLRRAVWLMTVTSFLVPAGGLLTAPILARALGADGRGEMAAALAPASLMLAVTTLGLPEALTFFVANYANITRRALLWSSLITVGLGGICLMLTAASLSFLSAGDPDLGRLIMLATAVTVPALVVGVFRGAATGRQMWGAVAVERLVNTGARVGAFLVLWIA
jgi:O-antigen/teichoic acid export membrane protein